MMLYASVGVVFGVGFIFGALGGFMVAGLMKGGKDE